MYQLPTRNVNIMDHKHVLIKGFTVQNGTVTMFYISLVVVNIILAIRRNYSQDCIFLGNLKFRV